MQNIVQQFVVQKTPEEQRQEDAIFLSQNAKTQLFHIQCFNGNFLENTTKPDDSVFNVSKEMLLQRECENSPLFFKISGCVSYCPQLDGCCIFYNAGVTQQQMDILYSLQCQQEVYEEACKLYDNSLPNYKHLFQFSFDKKLENQFNLLGLSQDTLLLKVKNGGKRDRFMYNTALLQLQMMRFNFIISPKLTQVYMKTFLGTQPTLCIQKSNVPTNSENDNNDTTPPGYDTFCNASKNNTTNNNENNNTTRENTKYISAESFNIEKEQDSEDSDEYSSSEESENSVDYTCVIKRPKITETTNYCQEKKILETQEKTHSLVSSDTASNRDCIGEKSITSTESSVNFILPSNSRSETGLTEGFGRMHTSSRHSDTGLTEGIGRMHTSSKHSDTGITGKFADMACESSKHSESGVTVNFERMTCSSPKPSETGLTAPFADLACALENNTKKDCVSLFEYMDDEMQWDELFSKQELFKENNGDNLGEHVQYDSSYLITLTDRKQISEIYNNFSDLHTSVREFIKNSEYVMGELTPMLQTARILTKDPKNRFKQAIFLYILLNNTK